MNKLTVTILALAALLGPGPVEISWAAPLGTAFSYQGQLKQGGLPVTDTADFQFTMWDALAGGSQIGAMIPVNNNNVVNGLFTVTLDFGASVFAGDARWLEIAVRVPAGSGSFTTLSPRQELTPAPYSVYAASAPPDGDWTIAGNDIYRTNGKVGIGTPSPVHELHVHGAIRVTREGQTALGQLYPSTNLFAIEAGPSDDIIFKPGNLERVRFTAAGKVGIGTSSPEPAYKISVYQDINNYAYLVDTTAQGYGVLCKGNIGVGGTGNMGVLGYSAWGYGQQYDNALGVKGIGSRWGVVGDGGTVGGYTGAGILGLGKTNVYAGWFKGDVYVEGGQVAITGGAPGAGKVLTSDATGCGSWQTPAGLTLPYAGTTSTSGTAFSITNTGSGTGIAAYGAGNAGAFYHSPTTGYAYLGTGSRGIMSYGVEAGGYFEDTDTGVWADVATGSYKIYSTGTSGFVQNHPDNAHEVIVYACLEGDEVATYTRGTARVRAGEVRVPLGETFKWVTNPDIGLTAHVTPRGECQGLYVASLSTSEIVVRELGRGTSDVLFDYVVYGLRIGFEELSVVQEKQQQSYIPSMAKQRARYARQPELRQYNALDRFKAMRVTAGDLTPPDLSRAEALRDAVGEFNPAVHQLLPVLGEPPGQTSAGNTEESTDDIALHPQAPGKPQNSTILALQNQNEELSARLVALEALMAKLADAQNGGDR